ncbi:IS6 family transposase [Halobaculum sp. WSA2]|uniref:IS6 family transposase n=1 Tax=Halobaculum saliterrae TaxID=2073113 RepID=A0A6B0SQ27_9EURY|nr:IS6 family transposase [Halobaculum saliterrae]MXR40775.1 IS6 family transposase [Halobaculum saliterrae]
MAEFDRLIRGIDWIDLEFVERERTPEQIVEVGIQLHLAGLSLSNTKQYLERLGVERSRTAIHNWVQKADLQPTNDGAPNQIAVDETVIQINDERHWLYAAVDPGTNEFLHVRLFQTRTTQLTVLFLRKLREKQQVEQATFLIDGAHDLNAALGRLGLRFQIRRHGNRNSIERVFREVKCRTSSFPHTFSNVEPPTAESWLQPFAVWWNQC